MLQAKVSPAKPCRAFHLKPLRLLIALAVVFVSTAPSHQTLGQQIPGQTLVFPASIQWDSQPGVTWYRLQIGSDGTLRDIFYDRRVFGARHTVSLLPPGYYYWRIAPAGDQLGAFSRPVRFFVSGGVVTPVFISREYLDQTALSTPVQRR